ncbi:MAG: HEPN domain-containing protein [Rhodocyclaceae bacterium]|nr:HEPN domain-containing protein [Rhodocyclaceae bacterium]
MKPRKPRSMLGLPRPSATSTRRSGCWPAIRPIATLPHITASKLPKKSANALLTAAGIEFPKTHDLTALVALAEARFPGFAQCREAAAVLTPYGTSFRYPGSIAEPDDADLREAISLAERWLATVTTELGVPWTTS